MRIDKFLKVIVELLVVFVFFSSYLLIFYFKIIFCLQNTMDSKVMMMMQVAFTSLY